MLWNLPLRTPLGIARDLAGALRSPVAMLLGSLRFVAGLGLLVAGSLFVVPLCARTVDLPVLETWSLLAGLAVALLAAEPRGTV